MSWAECLRPMPASTSSEKVWGLMEIPGGPVLLDDSQLFGVGAVRAACFHRIFYDFGQVKILPHGAHELPQLVGRKLVGVPPPM